MGFTQLQQSIIAERGGNMLVSASAGSGKTTVMIARVLSLLSEGASLARMVICTFTRAAASDMREKLQNELIKAADGGALYAEEQLKLLPCAEISTIHSWCQRLVRDYFYALGVDPAFEILDESEAELMRSEAIDAAIAAALERGNDDFMLLHEVTSSRHGDDGLRGLIKKIYTFSTAQADPEAFLSGFKLDDELMRFADSIVKNEQERQNAAFAAKAHRLLDDTASAGFVRNVEPLRTFVDMLEGRGGEPVTPRGKIPSEYKALADEFSKLKSAYTKACERFEKYDDAQCCDGRLENALLSVVRDVAELYANAKRKKARLDYADLEHFTCALIRDESICREIKERYDYIFVDEYQDVNPLQERIINGIKANGNLFLVGDVKQSIYAFRMCDPRFFIDKYNCYAQCGFLPPFELNDNFRSCVEVLDFANEVFAPLMTESFGKVNYARNAMLRCGSSLSGGRVELNLILKPEKSAVTDRVYSVAEAIGEQAGSTADIETDVLVKAIADRLAGKDKDGNDIPPLLPSDIAVLTRTRNESAALLYVKLKKLGIRVAVSDEIMLSSVYEVSVLCSFMRALVDYTDDISLVAVLRSALVGVTDDELASIKLYGERGEERFYVHCDKYAREKQDATAQKLNAFYALRDRYLTYSYTHTASELIGALIAEKNWFLHVFSLPDAELKSEVLNAFLQQLATTSHGGSVYEYVRFLETDDARLKRPSESDALKIMTIHASKGLEFPCVYLINAEHGFNFKDLSETALLDAELGLCLKRADLTTRSFVKTKLTIAAELKQRQSMLEEYMRLLYVAVTRPKRELYVFATVADNDALLTDENNYAVDYERCDCFLDWLRPVYEKRGFTLYGEHSAKIDYSHVRELELKEKPNESLVTELKTYFSKQPVAERGAVLKQSVTALMSDVEEEALPVVPLDYVDDERAVKKGNAFHKAMQLIDFEADFDAEWEWLTERADIRELVDKEKIRRAAEKISELIGEKKIYREQQFIYDRRENGISSLVQGVIDLLITDGEHALIVDYKTSRIERVRSEKYRLQLSIYADAVRNALGLKVDKTYIYAFESDELIDIEA